MRYPNHTKFSNKFNVKTQVLLKVLAIGNREIEAGKVKPVADVVNRLRTQGKMPIAT
jgi:hypothetical protein